MTLSENKVSPSMPCFIPLPLRIWFFGQDPKCLTHKNTWRRYSLIIGNGWDNFLPKSSLLGQFRYRKESKSLGHVVPRIQLRGGKNQAVPQRSQRRFLALCWDCAKTSHWVRETGQVIKSYKSHKYPKTGAQLKMFRIHLWFFLTCSINILTSCSTSA